LDQFVGSRDFKEVNFWQPSARAPFTRLPAGTPFLFKLKRTNHHIAGGGFFVRFRPEAARSRPTRLDRSRLALAALADNEIHGGVDAGVYCAFFHPTIRFPQRFCPRMLRLTV
jgi:hypothetical protein